MDATEQDQMMCAMVDAESVADSITVREAAEKLRIGYVQALGAAPDVILLALPQGRGQPFLDEMIEAMK